MFVVGEDLLGPRHVTRRAFYFDRIGSQIDADVQTVFQHAQIFISRAEQGFDIRTYFDTLLHSVCAVGASSTSPRTSPPTNLPP